MQTIDVDTSDLAGLDDLVDRLEHPGILLQEIGEELVDSTDRRFETSTAPDGTRWAPNSETTILQYLEGKSGAIGKTGRLTKKGAGAVMAKRPLIGETRNLSTTISYQVVDGGRTLLVGSPQKYAAVQHFGADKGSLGRNAPWGDIPARPIFGISPEDERTILELIEGYLGASPRNGR